MNDSSSWIHSHFSFRYHFMLKSKEQVQVSNIFPKTKGEHASGLMLIVLKCVASAILPSEILY